MGNDWQEIVDEFINRHEGKNIFGASSFCINGAEFTGDYLEKRAKELGWVSGYLWGKEYPTNGKKPDLPDDLMVDCVRCSGLQWHSYRVDDIDWYGEKSFRVVDRRYKPKQPESHSKPSAEEISLQAGDLVEVDCHHRGKRNGKVIATFQRWAWCDVDGIGIDTYDMILVKSRKSEREKFVEAAVGVMQTKRISNTQRKTINRMFDSGKFKLIEDEKSSR